MANFHVCSTRKGTSNACYIIMCRHGSAQSIIHSATRRDILFHANFPQRKLTAPSPIQAFLRCFRSFGSPPNCCYTDVHNPLCSYRSSISIPSEEILDLAPPFDLKFYISGYLSTINIIRASLCSLACSGLCQNISRANSLNGGIGSQWLVMVSCLL